ncbi:uncharacterized protein LOC103723650 isoform X2 [Phoenix dactylifera]|uniref:Uncharacterized protein LOC103723650 isoform X2 n=1 Tax=Phoenix dactylifera TaxID=42345 RepID=A0A8B7D494_PHODC|nr:uncharacterized protein LOC103723650 isoform X2 [Phoenix dactylifera]
MTRSSVSSRLVSSFLVGQTADTATQFLEIKHLYQSIQRLCRQWQLPWRTRKGLSGYVPFVMSLNMRKLLKLGKPVYPALPEEPKGSRELLCTVGIRLPD